MSKEKYEINVVGSAQKRIPAHILQHSCDPEMMGLSNLEVLSFFEKRTTAVDIPELKARLNIPIHKLEVDLDGAQDMTHPFK